MNTVNKLKSKALVGFFIFLILNSPLLYANLNYSDTDDNINLKYTWGFVTNNQINIREFPDTYSKIVGKANKDDVLIVIGKYDKWYKVIYQKKIAWFYSKYLEGYNLKYIPEISENMKKILLRRQIVNYAKQFIGTPYRYGGTDLKKGVDCSGFTQGVMKPFNISLNRSSGDQIMNGKQIKKEDLTPADLIFFDTSGRNNGKICHVGMYIGNNKFIHASTSRGVTIDDLNQNYYMRSYVQAVSIID